MKRIKGLLTAITGLLLITMSPPLWAEETWLTDFQAARKFAQEKRLILLAAFVGSDWCPWCQKLESEIFNQPEFKEFAKDRFILFLADFPRHKDLPVELKNQNQELQKQYAVKSFPTVLFLDAEGKEIARMGYRPGGVGLYLEAIKSKIPQADTGAKEARPWAPSFFPPQTGL
jgi:thioredoxin-related protein